jgi:hypothetical protein
VREAEVGRVHLGELVQVDRLSLQRYVDKKMGQKGQVDDENYYQIFLLIFIDFYIFIFLILIFIDFIR